MKQEIKMICPKDIEELNKQGWYIKQVIEMVKGGLACSEKYFWVLLEKEN